MGIVNLNDGTILAPGLRFDQDPDTGIARSAANTLDFITNGVKQASLSTTTFTLVGGQIAFPATQVASADANTLDDYEEGTWTPALTFGGAAAGMTFASQVGRYSKIGNRVVVSGFLSLSAKGTSVGSALVTALPFTSANITNHITPVALRANIITYANMMEGYIPINDTTIVLQEITEAGTVTDLANTDFVDNSNLAFHAVYQV